MIVFFFNLFLTTKFVYLYLLYSFFVYMFNFQIFNNIGKLCMNDTLLALYVLSSSNLTIWFLFYLIYFIFFKISKNISNYALIVYSIISLYFFISNNSSSFIAFWLITPNINTTLQNGLLNIHPIYIYIIYAYIYIFWFYNYKIFDSFVFKNVKTSNLFSTLCVIIIGVYLGAFWASQELNWGGFWSWDPVELVSLFLLFWFLFTFHNKNNNIVNKPINHIIITAIIIYFIIRLGIVNTIHSFIKTNSRPFLSKICIILIIFYIILNKKKYYYIYDIKSTMSYKIYVIILFIGFFYLCVYIINLINFTNIYLISPIYFYLILIMLSIYIMRIQNVIEFYKYLLKIMALLIIILIFKINIIIIFLSILFLYSLYSFKRAQLHVLMLLIYFLFFLFFINSNIYNNGNINLNKYNINLNVLSNSSIFQNYYETFVFFKKCIYSIKLKSFLIHVSGFSIITNNTSSLFLFSKNNNIYFVFTLEIIYIFIYFIIILCIFILINYKYLDYKYYHNRLNTKNY